MSRAEFAAVIARLLKLEQAEGEMGFDDTPSTAWYNQYVMSLYEAGILTGFEDGSFKPNLELTREEAFVILHRALKERLSVSTDAGKPSFADKTGISSWANEAIEALTAAGMIKGYEDGTLRPKDKITRAEIASIVAGFVKS